MATPRPIRLKNIKGKVDFAILTIREDEFESVLAKFQPHRPVVDGKQFYEHCNLIRNDGSKASVAIVRAWDQGQTIAGLVTRDLLEDLEPRWIILTGIAGAVPDSEFTLGDVLLASSVIDFSITAAIRKAATEIAETEIAETQYRTSGAQLHSCVSSLLGHLPAFRELLGPWNHESQIGVSKPKLLVPTDIADGCFYGNDDSRTKVRKSLQIHFPNDGDARPPLFRIGSVASSNTLLKDTQLLASWKDVARQITHIEMEAAAVFTSARRHRPHEPPVLCARGISDVVGFNRSDEWTSFACKSVASFLYALLKTLPEDFFRRPFDKPPSVVRKATTSLPLMLTRLLNVVARAIESAAATARTITQQHERVPTVEEVIAAFRATSKPLVNKVVPANSRIKRPELEILSNGVKSRPSTFCLLGVPGSGKTSALALLAQDAMNAGTATFAIRADLLSRELPFESWGARQLGLGISPLDAVRLVASRMPMLVIVDQLDAISSTVDLTSDRLDSLLTFMAQCSSLSNVSMVCSCRTFDYKHDIRFQQLDAQTVDLELPPWTDVASQLEANGIKDSNSWSAEFRDILRTPQHLKIFLDRFRAIGGTDTFRSYHLMLDDLWSRSNLSEAELDTLYDVTQFLIDQETLWAPLSQFESAKSTVQSLQSKQLLTVENTRIGFRHQTLLEHAKARNFTKSGASFCKHVLDRQSSVQVRPTIWAVLQYLREAHRSKYLDELSALMDAELRLHVRYLLIEFLGHLNDPEPVEVSLLSEELATKATQTRVLIAIQGRVAWFQAFCKTHFPSIMSGPPDDQWAMIGVIQSAWDSNRDKCLDLIEGYWISDADRDWASVRAMREVGIWDERTISLATILARRAADSGERQFQIESLIYVISENRPDLAPRVFVASLPNESSKTQKDLSPGQASRCCLLRGSQGWHDLVGVAEASPEAFLRDGWNWLVKACENCFEGSDSSVLYQYRGSRLEIYDRNDQSGPPVLTAFCAAIDLVAASTPQRFLEITQESWSSENAVVHQLIIRGLVAASSSMPELGLTYLRGDRRRFSVGTYDAYLPSDSVKLIAAIALHLSPSLRIELEELIQTASMYRDVELNEERIEWDREFRIPLLDAIPSNCLSDAARAKLEAEKLAFPHWDCVRVTSKSGFVRHVPPISKEEMLTSSDDEILEAIVASQEPNTGSSERIEVDGGWEVAGGPVAAAEEIAKLASTEPLRAIELCKRLMMRGLEDAASIGLRPCIDSIADDAAAVAVAKELSDLDPKSEELRSQVGYMFYKRCPKQLGLCDAICAKLRRWLCETWTPHGIGVRESKDDSDESAPDRPESILWGSGFAIVDTDRSFWPLLAVTRGYLLRTPPACDDVLNTIDEQLNRGIAENTLAAYLTELRWLRLDGFNDSRRRVAVESIFERYPNLVRDRSGVVFIANLSDVLPQSTIERFLDSLRSNSDFVIRQAYGELLSLIAIRGDPHDWAAARLSNELAAVSSINDDDAIIVGITYAAAHLWDELEARPEACGVLCQIVPHITSRAGLALGTVFYAKEDFAADGNTERLLTALAENSASLLHVPIVDLVDHLMALVPHNRRLVLAVCTAIVNSGRRDSDLFEVGPHLVSISMTLQRFPDTRSDALGLLERLLELGLDDAFSILTDIDIRPATTTRRAPRPLRKRRRRR